MSRCLLRYARSCAVRGRGSTGTHSARLWCSWQGGTSSDLCQGIVAAAVFGLVVYAHERPSAPAAAGHGRCKQHVSGLAGPS
jgi:hypothetical protein